MKAKGLNLSKNASFKLPLWKPLISDMEQYKQLYYAEYMVNEYGDKKITFIAY